MTEELKARDARAGAITGRVRSVLITSLVLAAIAFVVVYGWFTFST
jgi:hypothetical protein